MDKLKGKPALAVDEDQQYKITVKIEDKADWKAKGQINL